MSPNTMSSDTQEPGFGLLLDWLENRLPAAQAADVAARVAAGDPNLQRSVAWLRAYLGAAERVHFASSPALQDRLVKLFEAQTRQSRPPSLLRRYVAALTSDSRLQLGTTGLRGRDDAAPRQLLFSAEVADIVLNLNTKAGKADLRGQIFPNTDTPPGNLAVQLLRDSVEAALTTTTETGVFVFANLSPGEYEVVAVGDAFEVHTAPIALDA
jgi:hypothetical protein